MSKYNGPVADAIEDIVRQRDFDGITAEEAVEEIVELVQGFIMAGLTQGQSTEEVLQVWMRGAVG
jgi:hypothetical protein